MKLERNQRPAGPIVTGFSGSGFKIDGESTSGGVLLAPEWWRSWGGELSEAALDPLVALRPEFILIGTGAALVRPPRPLVQALEAKGIGVEPMDSRAAARAWGVLRAEERWIGAALMALT
ncbi:Mth938-like domain-containing protein [Sphingomonas sp.]|uniref:Mth938-like domain-containing protein n=1 Tax=Sphingomonas sp. TaxID=28214 RepID=UPI002DEF2FA4|nr:Mth938-like domain-containing protein [Sphingomonas sp.]